MPTTFQRIPVSGWIAAGDYTAASEAASRLAFRYRNELTGEMDAVVLGANDYFEIDYFESHASTLGAISLYDGSDNVVDAGEQIAIVRMTNLWTKGSISYKTPHICTKATYPKIKQTAGTAASVEAYAKGYWNKANG